MPSRQAASRELQRQTWLLTLMSMSTCINLNNAWIIHTIGIWSKTQTTHPSGTLREQTCTHSDNKKSIQTRFGSEIYHSLLCKNKYKQRIQQKWGLVWEDFRQQVGTMVKVNTISHRNNFASFAFALLQHWYFIRRVGVVSCHLMPLVKKLYTAFQDLQDTQNKYDQTKPSLTQFVS